MPEPSATLAFLISNNLGLAVRCTQCVETKSVDVAALAVKYGDDATIAQLTPKLARCPRCGSRARLETFDKNPPPMGTQGAWYD
jgi:4-hydroxy-3-methylbut-2-en-1-yl diphosphate synthase IspG/GcpE